MIILLCGISASGKTTWAKEYLKNNSNSVIVSRDILREKYFPNNGIKRILPFQLEERITSIERKLVLKNALLNKDVIIDDTNLRQKYLKEWISIFEKENLDWKIEIFDISLEEAIKRNSTREEKVDEYVLRNQYRIFSSNKKDILNMKNNIFTNPHPNDMKVEIPKIDRPVLDIVPYNRENLKKLPLAVIVDIDGTITLTGNRDIYDYSKVDVDIPRMDVVKVIKSLEEKNIKIIIFSGRKLEAKEKTIQWLKNNLIPFNGIYLRNEEESNNNCSDIVAKYRMFNEVRDKYDFIGAFDDRPKVTRLYQELGLTTFFVGEYGKEF